MLISKAMAHCHRATRSWQSHYEAETGDDAAMKIADDEDARPTNIREVTAIIEELNALSKACDDDMTRAGAVPGDDANFGFLTARCVSWSTAIMVLDLYSCPEHMRPGAGNGGENGMPARSEAELALQVEAINGLRTAGLQVRDEARRLLSIIEGGSGTGEMMREETNSHLDWTSVAFQGENIDTQSPISVSLEMVGRFSPLCLDAIYCGMSTFGWLWRESGDPEMKQGLDITRRCLERLGTRWRLADEYLEIGKKQDGFMMEIMDLNGAG